MVIKNINPVLSKTGFFYFSAFPTHYFKEDIDPESTPENISQGIHDIGGSIGDKRLVNFIADAVKC